VTLCSRAGERRSSSHVFDFLPAALLWFLRLVSTLRTCVIKLTIRFRCFDVTQMHTVLCRKRVASRMALRRRSVSVLVPIPNLNIDHYPTTGNSSWQMVVRR